MKEFHVELSRDYSLVPKFPMCDSRLSLQAKGLISMLFSMADEDGICSETDYEKILCNDINALSAMSDLIGYGYIEMDCDKNNRIEYLVREKPTVWGGRMTTEETVAMLQAAIERKKKRYAEESN